MRVAIIGKPWGLAYEATTDAQGRYAIANVPVTHPRYSLTVTKSGYTAAPRTGRPFSVT